MILTVSLPNYNHGVYLATRIPSLLEAMPQKSELIIVDDGSTDNSKQIIAQFAAQDARIVFIDFPTNKGVIEALNTIVEQAKGKYIAFLSADDRIAPHFFSQLLHCADRNPGYPIYTSNYCTFDETMEKCQILIDNVQDVSLMSPSQFMSASTKGFWIPVHASIIELKWVQKLGGFNPKLKHHCDWFLAHSIALMGGVAYLPKSLSFWKLDMNGYTSREQTLKISKNQISFAFFEFLKSNPQLKQLFKISGLLYPYAQKQFFRFCLNPSYWDWAAYFLTDFVKRKAMRLIRS